MSNVYYENINVRNFKLLLAYTKDNVLRLDFNTGSLTEKYFLICNAKINVIAFIKITADIELNSLGVNIIKFLL